MKLFLLSVNDFIITSKRSEEVSRNREFLEIDFFLGDLAVVQFFRLFIFEYYYVIVFRAILTVVLALKFRCECELSTLTHIHSPWCTYPCTYTLLRMEGIIKFKSSWRPKNRNHTEINSKENISKGMKNIMKDSQIDPKAENSFLTMCRGIFCYFCK